ncbi:signal peptidase II [Bacteroides faecis]|uniref:signal peptidase II n=2 Tax=Bacteroides faecis TaxID=674529 RepID=UPI00110581A1|nr:signal peptidase II [Bacteroides faecis]KAA5290650.1 signal peptidase II [Bacteroides faecis]KAA5297568.1 signal peptidase II [Bacteroides faecis]
MINSNSTYYIVLIIFILSGGTGNVFERFINGFVTDYIRLNIPYFTYFNLDDVFVIFGITLFIYQSIRNNKMIGKIYSL